MLRAISSLSFSGPLEEKITAAAEAGFAGIEVFAETRALASSARRRGTRPSRRHMEPVRLSVAWTVAANPRPPAPG